MSFYLCPNSNPGYGHGMFELAKGGDIYNNVTVWQCSFCGRVDVVETKTLNEGKSHAT